MKIWDEDSYSFILLNSSVLILIKLMLDFFVARKNLEDHIFTLALLLLVQHFKTPTVAGSVKFLCC